MKSGVFTSSKKLEQNKTQGKKEKVMAKLTKKELEIELAKLEEENQTYKRALEMILVYGRKLKEAELDVDQKTYLGIIVGTAQDTLK